MTIATDGEAVCAIRLGRRRADGGRRTPLERQAARQIREYFALRRRRFDLPLRLEVPRFTATVLAAVEAIPFGETRTYGEIARQVGKPGAARAVGQAVGANPLPLAIPCHRVLAAGGGLGGFGAGLRWKRALLALEGVSVPRSRASRG